MGRSPERGESPANSRLDLAPGSGVGNSPYGVDWLVPAGENQSSSRPIRKRGGADNGHAWPVKIPQSRWVSRQCLPSMP